jgi:peptide/nickel transport system substrate-binding protein
MSRKHDLLLGLLVIFALFVTGCGGTVTPAVEETEPPEEVAGPTEEIEEIEEAEPTIAPEEPVVLRVGWLTPIDCWMQPGCASGWFTADLYNDPYFGKGDRCKAIPTRLLDSWEMSEDALTWTLTLHEGITFSNGEPLDAEGAAGFLEWYASIPSISYIYTSTAQLESVEVIDDLTFKMNTKVPVPFFADVEGITLYPLPPSVTDGLTEENVFDYENFPPIGTGPYVVTEWEPGSYVIFDARPDYHRAKPPIDRIVLQMYTNTDALVSAFLGGEIDMTANLTAEYIDTLKENPNAAIYEMPATTKYELEFNVDPAGTKHPAIEDPAVREAIDYAINRQQILDVALLGYGELCPTNWACPSVMPDQVNPALTVSPYDPEQAKSILAEAGYLDSDGDGILETPDGLPLEFALAYQLEKPVELTIADMITGYLSEIGIATEVEGLEAGVVNELLNQRDYDMFIYAMYTDVFAPIQLNWTSSCVSIEWGSSGRNFPGYCNEEFDALVDAAFVTIDPEEYKEMIFEAQSIMYEDRPFIVLAAPIEVQAVRDDRFEFPDLTCPLSTGKMVFTEILMDAVVK